VTQIWLPEAKADLDRLHTFLLDINPASAAKALQAILDGSKDLQAHPRTGRPMDDDTERREFFIPFGAGAYVLCYRIFGGQTIIVRVWHSREHR